MRTASATFFALSLVGCANTQGSPQPTLPLRQVRFYETGVAYYQRAGKLEGGKRSVLPVPASHLDDALKSLVVYSQNAQTRAVTFPSRMSPGLARSLARLPETGHTISMASLVQSLSGADVKLETRDNTYACRVVDVALYPAAKEGEPPTGFDLTIMTHDGAIRSVKSVDIRALTPTDPGHAERLKSAFGSAAGDNATASHALSLLAEGKDVTIGYISEAPLWRASYRLVLGNKGLARLQGWALIHNASDEPWKDVRVELATGRPDSFVYPLAAPRFLQRSLETPSEQLWTVPQLGAQTPDAMWSDGSGATSLAGLGLAGSGAGGGMGYGSGAGSLGHSRSSYAPTVRSSGSDFSKASASDLQIGDLAGFPVKAAEQGISVATYPVVDNIDLAPHHSASVPLLTADMKSEQVSYFTDSSSDARVGVPIRNETGYEWPEGPLAVLADGGFAGEVLLPRIAAGDARWLWIAADRVLTRETKTVDSTRVVRRIVRQESEPTWLREISETAVKTMHSFNSRYASPHTAVVTMSVPRNTDVKGADRLQYKDGTLEMWFTIPPHGVHEREVTVRNAVTRNVTIADIGEELLAQWKKVNFNDDRLVRAIDGLLERVRARGEVQKRKRDITKLIDRADADAKRLREHLAAFKGATPAALSARLIKAEDDLAALRLKQDALSEDENRAVDAMKEAAKAFPL